MSFKKTHRTLARESCATIAFSSKPRLSHTSQHTSTLAWQRRILAQAPLPVWFTAAKYSTPAIVPHQGVNILAPFVGPQHGHQTCRVRSMCRPSWRSCSVLPDLVPILRTGYTCVQFACRCPGCCRCRDTPIGRYSLAFFYRRVSSI